MYHIVLEIISIISFLLIIAIGPFAGYMQAITLWAGKKIAPKGMEDSVPNGFQDAITPKIQDQFNTILPICYAIILIAGTLLHWYFGILFLIVSLILMGIIKNFWPNKTKFYLKIIIHYMDNRIADYAKENDHIRSEAAKEMSDKLHELFEKIRQEDLEVPKFDEIKKMPLG